MISEQGMGGWTATRDDVDEWTPERRVRLQSLRARRSWRRAVAAVSSAMLGVSIAAVAVAGSVAAPLSARASAGWPVRVCPSGDCARPITLMSARQVEAAQVVVHSAAQAVTRKTTLTLTLQDSTGAATRRGALRKVVLRAGPAHDIVVATLPSLFRETGVTPRPATYTVTVFRQGAALGHASVTVTR